MQQLSLPTVCILPHIGSTTIEARTAMAELVANNVLDFTRGDKLRTAVNQEVYA